MSTNSYKVFEPFFSVIVNCRNSEKYLRDCLETIQNQTFSNFEVIIWDNASIDNTAKIAQEFEQNDQRFKLHSGRHSLKLGEARNCALEVASGRHLAFLDSDDLWDRDFLQQHYSAITKFRGSTFGIGNVVEISEIFDILVMNENPTTVPNTEQPKSIFNKLLKGNCVYFSSLVIPRSFFLDNAGFRNDFVQAEDYELLLRLAKKMPCYKTGLAYYRIHQGNATNHQEESLYRESIEILTPYLNRFSARISRLGAIGNYYILLTPLKSMERNNRILTAGVSLFEIWLSRALVGIFQYFRAMFRNRR